MAILRHCPKVFLLLISVLDREAWASGALRPGPGVVQTGTKRLFAASDEAREE
jgi:hypothetical protein